MDQKCHKIDPKGLEYMKKYWDSLKGFFSYTAKNFRMRKNFCYPGFSASVSVLGSVWAPITNLLFLRVIDKSNFFRNFNMVDCLLSVSTALKNDIHHKSPDPSTWFSNIMLLTLEENK